MRHGTLDLHPLTRLGTRFIHFPNRGQTAIKPLRPSPVLSIYLPAYLAGYLSIYLSIYLCVYLPVCGGVYVYIYMYVPVSLSLYIYIHTPS